MIRPSVKIHLRTEAMAGYFVLEKIDAHGGAAASIEKRSVVAWGYEKDDEFSIPYPITLGGVVVEDILILRPDGGIEDTTGLVFESFDECFNAMCGGGA